MQARPTDARRIDTGVGGRTAQQARPHQGGEIDPLVGEALQRSVDTDQRRLSVGEMEIAGTKSKGRRQEAQESGRGRRIARGGRSERGEEGDAGRRQRGKGHRDGRGRRESDRRSGRGRGDRRGRSGGGERTAVALAKEHHVEPAGPRAQLHVEDTDAGRIVGHLGAPLRLQRLLPLGGQDLAEELAQRVLRRGRNAEPLGGPEGQHLGFLVGPQAQLVGALLGEDGEEAVDAGHARAQRTAARGDSPALPVRKCATPCQ